MSLQHKGELSITELSSGEQALGNGQLPKTRSTPSVPGWRRVSTLQKSVFLGLRSCTVSTSTLEVHASLFLVQT